MCRRRTAYVSSPQPTNSVAMVALRSLLSPAGLASQPTSCQCLASPTRKHPTFTSTTSMPTTAASRNGCVPSMVSRRRTCPTTWAGAAPWRRWAKKSCPKILSSGLSDSGHINNQRHESHVFPLTSARSMYEPLHHLKFGLGSSYYDQIRAGLKYFIETRDKKRVCAMAQDTDFGRDITAGVKDQLAAAHMTLAGETLHKPTDTDFSASVARMRDANC